MPGLKRRPRIYSDDTPRDPGKWGWYIMIVIVLLWFAYSWFFKK